MCFLIVKGIYDSTLKGRWSSPQFFHSLSFSWLMLVNQRNVTAVYFMQFEYQMKLFYYFWRFLKSYALNWNTNLQYVLKVTRGRIVERPLVINYWTPAFSWKGVLWECLGQYVSVSVCQLSFFSRTAHRVFLKLCMKFWGLKGEKLTEPDFLKKISLWL